MNRSFMTKYSTVSQILLRLVVATLHWITQVQVLTFYQTEHETGP